VVSEFEDSCGTDVMSGCSDSPIVQAGDNVETKRNRIGRSWKPVP
jgi:hypothetical protein